MQLKWGNWRHYPQGVSLLLAAEQPDDANLYILRVESIAVGFDLSWPPGT